MDYNPRKRSRFYSGYTAICGAFEFISEEFLMRPPPLIDYVNDEKTLHTIKWFTRTRYSEPYNLLTFAVFR